MRNPELEGVVQEMMVEPGAQDRAVYDLRCHVLQIFVLIKIKITYMAKNSLVNVS